MIYVGLIIIFASLLIEHPALGRLVCLLGGIVCYISAHAHD